MLVIEYAWTRDVLVDDPNADRWTTFPVPPPSDETFERGTWVMCETQPKDYKTRWRRLFISHEVPQS